MIQDKEQALALSKAYIRLGMLMMLKKMDDAFKECREKLGQGPIEEALLAVAREDAPEEALTYLRDGVFLPKELHYRLAVEMYRRWQEDGEKDLVEAFQNYWDEVEEGKAPQGETLWSFDDMVKEVFGGDDGEESKEGEEDEEK